MLEFFTNVLRHQVEVLHQGAVIQLLTLPILVLGTASTSALWLTGKELVMSLGPVPVCIFRHRIPYTDIISVTAVPAGWPALFALARRWACLWRPMGYVHAMTLNKPLIEVRWRCRMGVCGPYMEAGLPSSFEAVFLASVDSAQDIILHVNWRKSYAGDDVEAPQRDDQAKALSHRPPLESLAAPSRKVRWILMDACEMLMSPWSMTQVTCCCWPNTDTGLPWMGVDHERTA
eukprot:161494-Amphidinium_carterae.2